MAQEKFKTRMSDRRGPEDVRGTAIDGSSSRIMEDDGKEEGLTFLDLPQEETMGQPSTRDPWAHRSEKMKCVSCMAYAPKNDILGRCRHNAPTMKGYPVVYALKDWCMQHKLDELFAGLE